MKLISVIIPAYNVAAYIGKTLDSLFVQLSDDVEVIVVDDGSKDETAAIVRTAFAAQNPDSAVLLRQENAGVSRARNAGLRAAQGKYVYFLDGDDLVSDELFAALRPLLIRGQCDIFCWQYHIINPDGGIFRTYEQQVRHRGLQSGELSGTKALENILGNHSLHIWTGSAVYRRDFLITNGLKFYPDCRRGQDVEFIQKALLATDEVCFLDKTLSFYVQRPGSVVHSFSIRRFDAVCASLRTSQNEQAAALPAGSKLSYTLKIKQPVDDFLFAVAFSMILTGWSAKKTHQAIDRSYPRLRGEIDALYVKKLRLSDPTPYVYLVYRLFPRLFVVCVRTFSRFGGV